MSQSDNASRRDVLSMAGTNVALASLAMFAIGADEALAPPDKQPPNLPIPAPPHKRIGFAVVGLGELAVEEILPAFALCENAAPVALVSGHPDKAAKIAAHYGIKSKSIYTYENYDSIRDNPEVEAIYIVLPNSMHAEFTVRGLQAGKHVLCEKPMAVTPDECQTMIDAAKKADRKLMIAYRLRYEPFNKMVIELMRKKALGAARVFSAENLQTTTAPNIRLSKALGGGPLGDVGLYCLNAARYVTREEPIEVIGQSWKDANDDRFREVDSSILFTLRFPSGALAHCAGGFDSARSNRFRITCDQGYIELDPAFEYRGQRLRIARKDLADDAKAAGAAETPLVESSIAIQHENHFAKEMDHFADCIQNNRNPLTPGEEGLRDMQIIAAINRSISEKRAVSL